MLIRVICTHYLPFIHSYRGLGRWNFWLKKSPYVPIFVLVDTSSEILFLVMDWTCTHCTYDYALIEMYCTRYCEYELIPTVERKRKKEFETGYRVRFSKANLLYSFVMRERRQGRGPLIKRKSRVWGALLPILYLYYVFGKRYIPTCILSE